MIQSSKKGGANLVLIVGVIIVFLLIVVFIRNINKKRSLSPETPSTTAPVDQAQDELDLEIGEIEDIEKELQDLESELQGL